MGVSFVAVFSRFFSFFLQLLLGFTGFLLGFIELYSVILTSPGFTGLILSFTGLYLVLYSFT